MTLLKFVDFITLLYVVVVVVRYLDDVLNNVSFDESRRDERMKLDKLLSYGLASELQCLRSQLYSSPCSLTDRQTTVENTL